MKRGREDPYISSDTLRDALDYVQQGLIIFARNEGDFLPIYANTVTLDYISLSSEALSDIRCPETR